jgi:hypothetical protein
MQDPKHFEILQSSRSSDLVWKPIHGMWLPGTTTKMIRIVVMRQALMKVLAIMTMMTLVTAGR